MSPVEIGLRLAGNLRWLWLFHDHHREGLERLDQALSRGEAAPVTVRAQALYTAGLLAGFMNELARAQVLLSESVALCREGGDRRQLSIALSTFAWATWTGGQHEQATAYLEEGLALAREVGEPWPIAIALMFRLFRVATSTAIERAEERAHAWEAGGEALHLFKSVGDGMNSTNTQQHLARIALYEGDYDRARAACVACLPLLRAFGWHLAVAETTEGLAEAAHAQGDNVEATNLYSEALALYSRLGDQCLPAVVWVHTRLAAIALEQGEWATARIHLEESLTIGSVVGPKRVRIMRAPLPGALEMGAALATAQGAPQRAMQLAGAAAALRTRLDQPLLAPKQAMLERRLAHARQVLSTEEQAVAWAEGQVMTPEQAIARALEWCSLT